MDATIPQHPSVDEDTIISTAFTTYLSATFEDPVLGLDLHDKCVEALRKYVPIGRMDDTERLLQAFIAHLPVAGRLTLMQEIVQHAADPHKIRQLRNFLVDALLKPFRHVGFSSPTISPAVADGFEDDIDASMAEIDPSSRKQTELREKCLARDGHRCVVTKGWDTNYFYNVLPASRRLRGYRCTVQCAHILPFALRKFEPSKPLETRKTAITWWALYRYFPIIGPNYIQPSTINQPENAMMLDTNFHQEYNAFRIAFEPGEKDNTYRTHLFDNNHLITSRLAPTIFTLRQHSPENDQIPLPNPSYFRIHFILAKIFNADPPLNWSLRIKEI